jgi:D-alanyl-D-alanine-carboxypeptidase/D-alanyl-D-alanine-endopeptidase
MTMTRLARWGVHWPGRLAVIALGTACLCGVSAMTAAANDSLLAESVDFAGQALYLETGVPALVIGAIRGKETAVSGFGERADGTGQAPNGDTVMRIGSITKVFTGQVLASLTADGTVALSEPLTKYVPAFASHQGGKEQPIRLIDLATQSAGTPRELPREPGPENDPFATVTLGGYANWLKTEPLLFTPGSAVLYSNFGFDLLAAALAKAGDKPYPEILADRITRPLGLSDTTFAPSKDQKARLMQGHDFDGAPLPDVPTGSVIVGAGGLYSTPSDLLRWLQWHLDRSSPKDAEVRLLDHAAYLPRDGLNTVFGMDESGHMDAMSLGWVVMNPKGDRPLLLQKAGGLQGIFAYIAFAPTRGVGALVAINKFDFSAAMTMAEAVNDLIAGLAPR